MSKARSIVLAVGGWIAAVGLFVLLAYTPNKNIPIKRDRESLPTSNDPFQAWVEMQQREWEKERKKRWKEMEEKLERETKEVTKDLNDPIFRLRSRLGEGGVRH
jgi:hypothetical protein